MATVDDRNIGSLAVCIAHILGVDPSQVPANNGVALSQWLAQRNLGLVPVESPENFKWPGRFLGLRSGSSGWAVLFGVPPGVIYDPAGEPNNGAGTRLDAAFVLAEHDPSRSIGVGSETGVSGVVESIAVAAEARGPMRIVSSAEALKGRGLQGDRYERSAGTFSDPNGRGNDLTLVEAEALEELAARGVKIPPAEARRNLVVRDVELDSLIGKRFRVGEVECFGQRRCEPCAHLERLTRPGVLRGLVHRGGLRADILSNGEIHPGDRVETMP